MKSAVKDLPLDAGDGTKRTALAYEFHFRDIYQRQQVAAGQEASAHICPDYALRSANFAFGCAGERQAAAYCPKYGEWWKRMEKEAEPKPVTVHKPKYAARPI